MSVSGPSILCQTASFLNILVQCSIILSLNNTKHQQNAINNLNLRWSDAPNNEYMVTCDRVYTKTPTTNYTTKKKKSTMMRYCMSTALPQSPFCVCVCVCALVNSIGNKKP